MFFFRSMTWEKCQKQTALAVEHGWNYFSNIFLGWESQNLMKDMNPPSKQLVSKVNLAGMTCEKNSFATVDKQFSKVSVFAGRWTYTFEL